MFCSYESGLLEDPKCEAPESLYQMTKNPKEWPDKGDKLDITFKKGIPTCVKNCDSKVEKTDPLEMFDYLNEIG